MSKFHWIGLGGATKSDWDDGRNWEDESGAEYLQANYPGSVAGRKDEIIFESALATGALSPLAYDASADEEYLIFRVGFNYDGTIAVGGFIKFEVESSLIIDGQSSGVMNLELIDVLTTRIEASRETLTLKGTFQDALFLKGNVVLDAATTFASSVTIGFLDSETDLELTIPDGVTLTSLIEMYGGDVDNYNDITLLKMSDGTWRQETGDIAAIDISDGTIEWLAGDITSAVLTGGTIDGSESIIARELTYAIMYGDAEININNGQGNIKVGNHIKIAGTSVNLSWSLGDKVTNIIGGGDVFYSCVMKVGAKNEEGEYDNLLACGIYLSNLGADVPKTLLIHTGTFADATAGSFPANTEIYSQSGVSGITGNLTFAGLVKITGAATTGNITNTGTDLTTLSNGSCADLNIKGEVKATWYDTADITQTVGTGQIIDFFGGIISGNVVLNTDSMFTSNKTQGQDVTAIGTGLIIIEGGAWQDLTSANGGSLTNSSGRLVDLGANSNVIDSVCLDIALYDGMNIRGGSANTFSQAGVRDGVKMIGVTYTMAVLSGGLRNAQMESNLFVGGMTFGPGDTGTFGDNDSLAGLVILAALADANVGLPVDGIHAGYDSSLVPAAAQQVRTGGNNRIIGLVA